jgi:hypothetical protein
MVSKIENRGAIWQAQDASSRSANIVTIYTLIFSLLGCGAIYVSIKIGGSSGLIEVFALVLAAGLLIQAWRKWEFGVQALLVVVIAEGAVRKWFLPSYAELVYFYKDGLMLTILIGYLRQWRKPPFVIKHQFKLFLGVLGAFVLYAFAIIFNPSAPHPLVSLMGVKAYCLYMPLAFIVPRMFPTKEKLVNFLKWYLVIALAVAALGALQFMDGNPDSELNRYAWSEDVSGSPQDTALFVDAAGSYYVRITSTFSFITGLTVYLPVMFALLLGLVSLRELRSVPLSIKCLYYATLGGVVVAAFMSGSRSVIVNLIIVTAVFYAFTSLGDAIRRFRQFAIAAVVVGLTLIIVAPHAVDALYTRAFGGETQVEEGGSRMAEIFRFPFEEAGYAGAFGYGIGATQNGVPALMKKLDLPFVGEQIPIPVESESSRVMLELGVVGFLLFGLLRLTILVTVWRVCMMIREPEHKSLAVAAFAALVFPLVAGGAVTVHTQNVYQWFLIGTIFALLNAERLPDYVAEQRASQQAKMQMQPALKPATLSL